MTKKEWKIETRVAMIRRGETLENIAKAINYSASHVRKVASGCADSKRVEDAMSNYLGVGIIDERE